jgi:hypothetical protein
LKGTGCVTGLEDLVMIFGGRKLATALVGLVDDFGLGVSERVGDSEAGDFTALLLNPNFSG